MFQIQNKYREQNNTEKIAGHIQEIKYINYKNSRKMKKKIHGRNSNSK